MRLSTGPSASGGPSARDEARSRAVIEAALDVGVRLFDTAPSYALDERELGHNERLIASCLRDRGIVDATVVTKAGLTRRGTAWIPDGRRKAIEASAEASCARLGRPLDVLLLHTVDPAVPLATSVRALEGLRQQGIAKAIGLSNVSRTQLDEALTLAELSYVEVALSVFDDHALKSGVVARAQARGLTVLAHTPLGGPKRAKHWAAAPRDAGDALHAIAQDHRHPPASIAIAYLVGLGVVPLVGATRPETARALGAIPVLSDDERRRIAERHVPEVVSGGSAKDLVLLVGIQGAGKSTTTEALRSEGHAVMSRDARGGTLSGLAKELASTLAGWASDEDAPRGVVIDGTYGTRAQRAEIVAVAQRAGSSVRAIHLNTDPRVAQANVVQRIVRALGRLPTPEELRRSKDPRIVPPRALFQYVRAFEPLEASEGFASIETRAFERRQSGALRGLEISPPALERAGALAADRVLVYGWAPRDEARRAQLEARAASFGVPFEVALCPHGEGPPICWCRPPLPGLVAAWVELNDVDVARSTLVGAGPIDRAIARGVGLSYVE